MLEHEITDPAYGAVIDRAVEWATTQDGDPIRVIIAATWLTKIMEGAIGQMADARSEAVASLKAQGFTNGEIGDAVGLSRQRIAQLGAR